MESLAVSSASCGRVSYGAMTVNQVDLVDSVVPVSCFFTDDFSFTCSDY